MTTEPKGRARRLPLILEAIGYGLLGLWLVSLAIVWIAGEVGDAGWWASDPGRSVSGLAFVAVLAGIPVGLVVAIVIVLARSARQILTATGMIVAEPDPPPPLEPATPGPAWRVTLPDGPHIVYVSDGVPNPKRLVCDGRWVEVTWPRKWGRAEGVFSLSGHRATLVGSPDWQRTFSWKRTVLIALLGGGYRDIAWSHDLRVDDAAVQPLTPEPASPAGSRPE